MPLASFDQLAITSFSNLLTMQNNKTSFHSLFFHTFLHGISYPTFSSSPLLKPHRNGTLFSQSSYIRPGTHLFSPTNNSVLPSKPHSGMKGAGKPIGVLGTHNPISQLPAQPAVPHWFSYRLFYFQLVVEVH